MVPPRSTCLSFVGTSFAGVMAESLAIRIGGSRTANSGGGNTGDAVGSVQTDEFKSHNHTVSVAKNPGATDTQGWPSVNAHLSLRSSDHFANVNGGSMTAGSLVDNAGVSESRPKNAYVNYIIKY